MMYSPSLGTPSVRMNPPAAVSRSRHDERIRSTSSGSNCSNTTDLAIVSLYRRRSFGFSTLPPCVAYLAHPPPTNVPHSPLSLLPASSHPGTRTLSVGGPIARGCRPPDADQPPSSLLACWPVASAQSSPSESDAILAMDKAAT